MIPRSATNLDRRRRSARGWLATSLLVMLALTSCGGPSAPREAPSSSPLSPRAPSAPLPTLGSSFEDPPLTEDEQAPVDHSDHGAPADPDEAPEGHKHGH